MVENATIMTNEALVATFTAQVSVFVSPTFVSPLQAEFHYVMALKGRCHIYETAFDSKVDKRSEESGDLIDRIANHPILQLLHIRRRSKPNSNSNTGSPNNNGERQSKSTFYAAVPSTSTDPNQQVGVYTPKSGRYSRFPARSVSTNQLSEQRLRPIGLSKSDDEILNRASDSPEEDDYLEDYREGSHTQDLANDLHSLHITTQNTFAKVTLPSKDSPCLSTDTTHDVYEKPSPSVHYSSAHFRPSDKCRIPIHHSSARPFASSLSKFGSRVQPEKYLNEPRVNLIQGELSKSQLLPLRKGLQPLKLHSPPGTAPLPVKFSKKTPVVEKSPSSWFSPIRQKDLKLPVKKSFHSQSEMAKGSSNSSTSSLNDSMVVLLDTGSQRDLKDCLLPPTVNVKYSSVDSVATGSGMSSMESLRSSMSDGSKSTASNESAISSYRSSSVGSDSSLVTRPFLNLNAPHRSLIQSAKFQILSPISDKSQEPSLETGGGLSQKNSPQDLLELSCLSSHQKTPSQTPRNIQDDFRNVHHILPGPPPQGQPGSDSGISIEYKNHQNAPKRSQHLEIPFNDLPFDMPKLRRRLAAAKASLSSSNSSISSSAPSSDANARFSLPSNAVLSTNPTNSSLNPTISRLQVSSDVSRTSSSNSSDWDTRSSAESSEDQGTPRLQNKAQGRRSLALELGCAAMSAKGQEIDVQLPLTKQNWYHGAINRQEAEAVLRSHSEGSYIVRAIRSSKHDYSLALKSARGFMHLRMHFDYATGGYKMGRSDKLFPSVPHIISHFSVFRIPIKGAEHMVLLHPIPSETL